MSRGRRRNRRRWLALVAAAAAFAAGAGVWLHGALYKTRYAAFSEPVFVDIARGTPTRKIGAMLVQAGVLRQSWHLHALRVLRPAARLQAGDYQFSRPASAAEVFDRLARGDIYLIELRVPEGSSMFDIARLVEERELMPAAAFLEAARSPGLIVDLDPAAPSLEGYLFPSTYRFRRRVTPGEICRAMTTQFRQAWRELGMNADVHRAVTLASLVEKETAQGDERGRIAGVFSNRLARGMTLDCDPTVIYAALLSGRWRGTIYRSDLDRPHPYNTYRNPGLPPGPIANPGLKALEAALAPDPTEALFFVARPDGSGTHAFSSNRAAHERAVAAYRRGTQTSASKTVARVAAGAKSGTRRRNAGR